MKLQETTLPVRQVTQNLKITIYLYEPDEALLIANEFVKTVFAIQELVLPEDKKLYNQVISLQIKIMDLYAEYFPERVEELEDTSL